MTYDVAVVGAGPAGATASIMLARAGLKVCVLERDRFPRHKLCGEFLSGDGRALLDGLALTGLLVEAGAVPVERCILYSPSGVYFESKLPGHPISLSRYRLDFTLLNEARLSGVDVYTGSAVTCIRGSLAHGFEVRLVNQSTRARAAILACGRSSSLNRRLGLPSAYVIPDPLVAFKTHFGGRSVPQAVELLAFDGGYCGIQQIEDDRVNVCWITRASALRRAGGKPERMLDTVMRESPVLAERIGALERRAEKFLAVSQLGLRPRTASFGDFLLIGDAAGTIAPMCGDGMSMAIAGACMAVPLVVAFLDGRINAREMKDRYRREWRRSFVKRMRIGRLLHFGFERSITCEAGIRLSRRFPSAGRWLIVGTRGKAEGSGRYHATWGSEQRDLSSGIS